MKALEALFENCYAFKTNFTTFKHFMEIKDVKFHQSFRNLLGFKIKI